MKNITKEKVSYCTLKFLNVVKQIKGMLTQ